jgi:hypothetical protein
LSDDKPFIIDEELTTYNAPERADDFYTWILH